MSCEAGEISGGEPAVEGEMALSDPLEDLRFGEGASD